MLSSFKKNFEKIISILQFSNFKKILKVGDGTCPKKWVKFWKHFGKIFLKMYYSI